MDFLRCTLRTVLTTRTGGDDYEPEEEGMIADFTVVTTPPASVFPWSSVPSPSAPSPSSPTRPTVMVSDIVAWRVRVAEKSHKYAQRRWHALRGLGYETLFDRQSSHVYGMYQEAQHNI